MSRLAPLLDDCLLPFFTLTTLLLAVGCGLMGLMRSPAHRQRTGELTLAAIFGWWSLACLPLPRLLPAPLWTLPNFHSRAAAPAHQARSDLDRAPSSPLDEREPGLFSMAEAEEALLETGQPVFRDEGGEQVGRPSTPLRDGGTPLMESLAAAAPSRVATLYLAGAAGCALWLAYGRIRLARVRKAACRPPAWLAQMFARLAEEAGQRPLLVVSRHSRRPMSWGVRRPIIVLPLAMARRRHRDRVRMVLLHELAHVVRGDGWGNGLLCVAFPLLYAHPLFWWLRGQVRMAAELLADDWAAQRGGKLEYVEQLVSLARSSTRSPAFLPLAGAVTLYSSSSQFYRRMQMLISRTRPLSVPTARWRLSSLAVAALIAALAASMAGVRPAWSQQLPSGEQAPSQPEAPAKASPSSLSADSGEVGAAKIASEKDPSAANVAVGEEQVTLRRDIVRAEADIVVAKQKLSAAENKLHYSRKMHRKGYVTQLDVESNESALEKAKLDLEAAELSKEVLDRQLEKLPFFGRLHTVAHAATAENPANADEQALRARLAAAEERIRLLEAQLTKAGIRLAGVTPDLGKTAPQSPDKVTLTRVEEDGSISDEIWTTSEDGRPDKFLSTKVRHSSAESPIAAAKTTVSQDGRVVKEFTGKDGTVTTHVYDPDTGRLIETRRAAGVKDPAATKSADRAEPTKMAANKSGAVAESRGTSITVRDLPPQAATGAETAGLDLIKLATAYADAVGAVEEAEAKVAVGGPESNLAPARAALRGAQRKQELLRKLASVAAEAARAELERTQQLVRGGAASSESATAAELRWKMLNAILQSGTSGNADTKRPENLP